MPSLVVVQDKGLVLATQLDYVIHRDNRNNRTFDPGQLQSTRERESTTSSRDYYSYPNDTAVSRHHPSCGSHYVIRGLGELESLAHVP